MTVPFRKQEDKSLRLPPRNMEAEAGLLCSLMQDNALIEPVRGMLRAKDFYRDSHQLLYDTILRLEARGVPVDGITVSDEMATVGDYDTFGGDEELSTILSTVPGPANAMYYAAIILEKSRKRDMIVAAEKMLDDAYSDYETFGQIYTRAAKNIESIDPDSLPEKKQETADVHGWPEPIGRAAYRGVIGEVCDIITPQTEADPAAVLVQFLVALGNLVGRGPHWMMGPSRHGLNLYATVVGASAQARKGTSYELVRHILGRIDPIWEATRTFDGLSSGEGLLAQIRDDQRDEKGQLTLPGIEDKRMLAVESEFGGMLGIANREGNSLNPIIRKLWDARSCGSLTRNSKLWTTDPHVSIIGHITTDELDARLTGLDAANGFANRFMWVCARRARFLPNGGRLPYSLFNHAVGNIHEIIAYASDPNGIVMGRSPEAGTVWEAHYRRLTTARPGLLGSLLSRAAPIVMRIACIYALCDMTCVVSKEHMEAALEVWRYCEESAAHIFGAKLGNPDAERLLTAIRAAPDGLNRRTILTKVFGGHMKADELDKLLVGLARTSLVRKEVRPTSGRPAEIWHAAGDPEEATDSADGQI